MATLYRGPCRPSACFGVGLVCVGRVDAVVRCGIPSKICIRMSRSGIWPVQSQNHQEDIQSGYYPNCCSIVGGSTVSNAISSTPKIAAPDVVDVTNPEESFIQ